MLLAGWRDALTVYNGGDIKTLPGPDILPSPRQLKHLLVNWTKSILVAMVTSGVREGQRETGASERENQSLRLQRLQGHVTRSVSNSAAQFGDRLFLVQCPCSNV